MKKIVAIVLLTLCLKSIASQNDASTLRSALNRLEDAAIVQSLIEKSKFSQETLNSSLEIARNVLKQGFEKNDPEIKMKAALNAGCLIAAGAKLSDNYWSIGESTKFLYQDIVNIFYDQFLKKYFDFDESGFNNKTADMIKRMCSSNQTIMQLYQDKLDDLFKNLLKRFIQNKPKIQQLINMGVDLNFQSTFKQPPLIDLLHYLYPVSKDAIELLLDLGAQVNVKDQKGATPLMLAIQLGQPFDVIKLLLDKGAQVNTQDLRGKTVFWYASQNDTSPEIIQLLLESLNKEIMTFSI